jgi:hypothetical protein
VNLLSEAAMLRVKTATLDLILKANGQPTGDELRMQAHETQAAKTAAEKAAAPYFLNSKQRRNLRKVLAKAQQTEDSNP